MKTVIVLLTLFFSRSLAASCPDQHGLLSNPADPSVTGPYPVGRVQGTIKVADGSSGAERALVVEAWYPAPLGSSKGKSAFGYDIREHVPPKQRDMLKDAANETYQACDCFENLPVADSVFPVVLYIHGTAAFRTESLHQQTHWASRGFIVVAADHPGIQLYDELNIIDGHLPPKTNQTGDGRGILSALQSQSSFPADFSILQGHMDWHRVAVVGHSAGGFATDTFGDLADVLIPMAGFAPKPGSRVKSSLVLAARNDTIVDYAEEVKAYADLKLTPRRFASVDALGHLFCSDLCWIGADAGGIVQIAIDHGIQAARLFKALGQNGCAYLNSKQGTHYLQPQCGWALVNYASSAALEETLRCDSSMTAKLAATKTDLVPPQGCPNDMVFDYKQDLGASLLV